MNTPSHPSGSDSSSDSSGDRPRGVVPPWLRGPMNAPADQNPGAPRTTSGGGRDAPTTQMPRATLDPGGPDHPDSPRAGARQSAGSGSQRGGSAAGTATRERGASGQSDGAAQEQRRPFATVVSNKKGPRRASLQVKQVDPWSVLKLSLVLSLVMFLVWMIAVGVLYVVLDGMGVWDRLNTTFTDFVSVNDPNSQSSPLIGPGRVFGAAAILGALNIVLVTALATISSFIYNLTSDLVGGVEVTLTERD